MSNTRRSLSPTGVIASLVALVAMVAVAGFITSTVQATSATNALINQRTADDGLVARGHVLVRESSTTREESVRVQPATAERVDRVPSCEDGDPCWNPCTMGEDGRYPHGDPRRAVPGPCDMGTELPYGGRFAVTVTPNVTMTCDDVNGVRYVAVDVTVSVVSPDRVTRHDGVSRTACVLAHAPFAGGAPVDLTPMFREVADQL